ncbi:dTDP-4-dehydrorhamnose 3,5-epimerase [soil metagenome]
MLFTETPVAGAYVVSLEPRRDDRGFFARAYAADEMEAAGIPMSVAQSNLSVTHQRGTVRGMHFQVDPAPEAKLVRCPRGAMYDVVADVRPDSPTYGTWFGTELTQDNNDALYLPPGCAHGFQTLVDETVMYYDASAPYTPDAVGGARYDDPVLAVRWPLEVMVISDQDRSWPLLDVHSAQAGS